MPAILGVNKDRRAMGSEAYSFPATCPACQSAVVQRPGEVAVRCPNYECPAQVRRRLEHFASQDCVDIEGLGPATIDALADRGLVRNVAGLYQLQLGSVVASGLNQGLSAERLIAAIETSKRAELWRFIHGLGIPQVGPAGAKEAARRFGSLAALAKADAGGDALERALAAYFAEPRNRSLVERLIAAGVQPRGELTTGGPVSGKIFVLTGALPTLTRAQATGRIEAAGGRVAGTVTRAAHYVVAGREPGAKLDQARTVGVEVIDEAGLLRMLDQE